MRRTLVLVLALLLTAAGGASARADSTASLPITGLSSIQVDDAHQQMFLTGDPADDVLLVTDMTGHVVKTFSGESGAAGMVFSGTTLYVARCGTTTIDTFDTASLTKTGSIATEQTIGTPCDLARAGSRLWFTSSGNLVSVALAAGHAVVGYDDDFGGTFSTAPGAANLLLANRGSFEYGGPVRLYNVGGAAPQTVGETSQWSAAQLVPPAGGTALATHTTQSNLYEAPTPDLYPSTSQYEYNPPNSSAYPMIAVTADGAYFAASTSAAVQVFKRKNVSYSLPWATIPMPGTVLGMAFSADASKLFVLERGGGTTIHTISTPLRPGSFITAGSSEVQIDDPADFGAILSFGDGASPLGKTVSLTLIDPDGHQTAIGDVTTDDGGNFGTSFPDGFDRAGSWYVRSVYAGDSGHRSTEAFHRILVSKRTANLTIGVAATPMVAGTTTTVSGAMTLLGPDAAAGRDVAVYATPPGGSEALIGTVATDSTGAYSVDTLVDAGGAWSFRAAYAGDSRYAAAGAGPLDVTADRQRAQVSITAGRSPVTYGSKVTLTATLGTTHTNRVVQIVRVNPDGSHAIIGQGAVDADGHFRFVAGPKQTNRYLAQFPGAAWFAPTASKAVTVQVRPVTSLIARNAYRTVSGIRLFHYASSCVTSGRGCPVFTGAVRPNHAGKLVEFVLQRRTGTRWKAAGSARFRLGRLSQQTVFLHYRSATARTGLWRTRLHFFADSDHVAADSAWLTFRITT